MIMSALALGLGFGFFIAIWRREEPVEDPDDKVRRLQIEEWIGLR
jgi:hypothetical protein